MKRLLFRMNKNGEIATIGIIIISLTLLLGLSFYNLAGGTTFKNKLMEIHYVGDSSLNITYNLTSTNPTCNLKEIKINEDNLIFFGNIDEIPVEYAFDGNCD